MHLPGFTAEVPLNRTPAAYQAASDYVRPDVGRSVLPQYFFCHGNYCCNEWGYCIYKGHVLM